MVQHALTAFLSYGSQDSSSVLTITLENIRMSLRHEQMGKFNVTIIIYIVLCMWQVLSLHKSTVVCYGFNVRCVLEEGISNGFFFVSSKSVRLMNYSVSEIFKLYG